MKRLDQVFGWLLIVGSCGHTAGTFVWMSPSSDAFVWSLGSSLAAALLGTLNLVRAGRPHDKTLAIITAVGTACWAAVAFGFGLSIGNVFDPRALMHCVTAVALVIFSVMTWSGASHARGVSASREIQTA